jgi:hypothetical protein
MRNDSSRSIPIQSSAARVNNCTYYQMLEKMANLREVHSRCYSDIHRSITPDPCPI